VSAVAALQMYACTQLSYRKAAEYWYAEYWYDLGLGERVTPNLLL
jgi:hypothetical protein